MAEKQNESVSGESLTATTKTKFGEFPYPLTDGPEESRYLTWLRNHSNYMAVRGFLDYLRLVGVLVRGIIVNFLIFLPYLLIVAIVLAYFHHWMLDHPFWLTMGLMALGLIWILLFPIMTPLFKIFSYSRSLETGSESSVKQRDLYERSFGAAVLVIVAVALLESLPWALEFLHDLIHKEQYGWTGMLATLAGILALLSGSDKLLSVLSGAKKKLAMALIGVLGLLVPLLVILLATDFLVYGVPPTPSIILSPLLVPVVGVLGILIALPLGLFRGAFGLKESAGVVLLLVGGVLLVVAVIAGGSMATYENLQKTGESLREIIEPLNQVAREFKEISNEEDLAPEAVELVGQMVTVQRSYKRTKEDIPTTESFKKKEGESDSSVHASPDEKGSSKRWEGWWADWENIEEKAKSEGRTFKSGQQFIALGNKLSALPEASLEPLRAEIAELAHDKLLERIENLVTKSKTVDVAPLLRKKLFEENIEYFVDKYSNRFADTEDNLDNLSFETVKKRLKNPVYNPSTIVKYAAIILKESLRQRTTEELAKLASERRLLKSVTAGLKNKEGKKAVAKLTGKEEHAEPLRKDEAIRLVLGHLLERLTADPDRSDYTVTVDVNAIEAIGEYNEKYKLFLKEEEVRDLEALERLVRPQAIKSILLGPLIPWGQREREEGTDRKPEIAFKLAELVPEPVVAEDSDAEDSAIVKVAAEELAKLALEDFNIEFLTMVALQPDLYKKSPDLGIGKQFKSFVDRLKAFDDKLAKPDLKEFKDNIKTAQLGEVATIKKLAVLAFEDTGEGADSSSKKDGETAGGGSLPNVYKLLLAREALKVIEEVTHSAADRQYLGLSLEWRAAQKLAQLARDKLVEKALVFDEFDPSDAAAAKDALEKLQKISNPNRKLAEEFRMEKRYDLEFSMEEYAKIAVAKFAPPPNVDFEVPLDAPQMLVSTMMFGKYGPLEEGGLGRAKAELSMAVMRPKAVFVFLLAGVIWLACWLTVDVNLTSIHGLYRDRLASAFLVGQDTQGDVDIEEDVDLEDICLYEARSTAPYHLVNVALNLQGSKDIGIRDRNSDFFIFSKRFVGGQRTGYCRSETLEQVFPQMSLATAMAISAAAASPNMGRGTSPPLVAFMTLLNIRLGYWMPNPGFLEEKQDKANWKQRKKDAKRAKQKEPSRERDEAAKRAKRPLGFTFKEVFRAELEEIERRWSQVYRNASKRQLAETRDPTARHGLVGIGFSGGGIRSATINLGIAQALHKRGVFGHLDYMSTVSGGGYLGSSISTLMRSKTKLATEIEGTVSVDESDTEKVVKVTGGRGRTESKTYPFSKSAELDVEGDENVSAGKWLIKRRGATSQSLVAGTVKVQKSEADAGDQIVWVSSHSGDERVYLFPKSDELKVKTGDSVEKKQELNRKPSKDGGENDGDDEGGSKADVTTSDIGGTVKVGTADAEEQFVSIASQSGDGVHVHRFSRFERVVVKTGDAVTVNQALVQRPNTFGERFRWRIRPSAFLREMTSRLDEKHGWVNLSDGGHLENLATIELLRRRCKYIIIGDGEADPNLHFTGLATLMRSAYIDLGIEIDIDLDELRLRKAREDDDNPTVSGEHWAIGKIKYPKTNEYGEEEGFLLYLKSSFTGDEGEVIREYRHRKPTFPHQTTADQMFDEGQFEAYRALGQHIAEQALKALGEEIPPDKKKMDKKKMSLSFSKLEKWLSDDLWDLWEKNKAKRLAAENGQVTVKRATARKRPAAEKGPATAKRATARKRPAAEKGPTTAKRATARKSRASAPRRTQKKTDT